LVQPIGNGCTRSGAVSPGKAGKSVKLLYLLVDSFVTTFGITRPKPEQQRTVALVLGGFLLFFFGSFFGLIFWMLFGVRR
jgi:hypothetical protein